MKTLTTLLAFISFSTFAQIELNKSATCSAICTVKGIESSVTKLVLGKGTNLEKALLNLQASCDANKTCDEETAEVSTAIGKTGTKSFDEKLACNIISDSNEFSSAECLANLQNPVIVCNDVVYQVSQPSFQIMSETFQSAHQKNIETVLNGGIMYLKVKISGNLQSGGVNVLNIHKAEAY